MQLYRLIPLLIPTWYKIFYINYIKLSSSTCFECHPLIFRRSMMLIVHVCSLWYSHSVKVNNSLLQNENTRGCIHVQLTSLTSWRWADDARNMYRNLILCNLYNNLCIKLVSIKELYYDARPTKSQDIQVNLLFLVSSTCFWPCFRPSSGAPDCIYSIW